MKYEPEPKLIERVLRQQGQVPSKSSDKNQLLIPPEIIHSETASHEELVHRFRTALARPTFRKIARTLTGAKRRFVSLDELMKTAGGRLEDYLEVLTVCEALEYSESGIRLSRPVDNIGPTLEWYVADLCQREFLASAIWAVKLEGMPGGGDYDVLAYLTTGVLCIEVKSSPPRSITDAQLFNFWLRTAELRPDISVFLVDTDDDLKGLVNRLAAIATSPTPATRSRWSSLKSWPSCPRSFIEIPDATGIYFGAPAVYVVNSHETISAQLRRCLRHHHVFGKDAFIDQHVPDAIKAIQAHYATKMALNVQLVG